ncbi:hypothetical protein M011DRAFT_479723 [Sporormia fimetaria CBS 119925]|uniref:Uncharacterized protein n=1 Tax=Sporormia fimetaria CBS 119925 TaxID=1340428 RepID=A0A6A6V4K9_9PLEO|nr:hypothetical protein M011DRAFT_479723 [Sporormia fimetaria CBS 119925]
MAQDGSSGYFDYAFRFPAADHTESNALSQDHGALFSSLGPLSDILEGSCLTEADSGSAGMLLHPLAVDDRNMDVTLQPESDTDDSLSLSAIHIDKISSCITSEPVPLPKNLIAAKLSAVPRFNYLFSHTWDAVQSHGPYRLDSAANLTCGLVGWPTLPDEKFVDTMDLAKQAMTSPQPPGPALDDLQLMHMLWLTTVPVMETVLCSNALTHDVFGWGMFGLTCGYQDPDPLFLQHKERLHKSLCALKLVQASEEYEITKARRSVHICAILILQDMRADWGRVRWGVAVKVCERWLAHLGWNTEAGSREEGPGMSDTLELEGSWIEEDGLWVWKDDEMVSRGRERDSRWSSHRRHSSH